jgi:hypothetical protein
MPSIKSTIKLTDNLLEKIKGKELVQCYFTPEGNVEL